MRSRLHYPPKGPPLLPHVVRIKVGRIAAYYCLPKVSDPKAEKRGGRRLGRDFCAMFSFWVGRPFFPQPGCPRFRCSSKEIGEGEEKKKRYYYVHNNRGGGLPRTKEPPGQKRQPSSPTRLTPNLLFGKEGKKGNTACMGWIDDVKETKRPPPPPYSSQKPPFTQGRGDCYV